MPKKVYLSDADAPAVSDKEDLVEARSPIKKVTKSRLKFSLRPLATFLSEKKWYILFILLIISSISSFAFVYYALFIKGKTDMAELTKDIYLVSLGNQEKDFYFSFEVEVPKTKENPINGELFTASDYQSFTSKPILAFMVENHPSARPQSGFSKADIVYETLVEGGITRMMAVYWSKSSTLKEVGPIRSARQYFLEWLSPYDPIYVHIGCAYSSNPKIGACMNLSKYGLNFINGLPGSTWRDNSRYSPHNAYSSAKRAYKTARRVKKYHEPTQKLIDKISSWEFKSDSPPSERGNKKKAKVVFFKRLNNYGIYDLVWQYDKSSNSYKRYLGGKLDKERRNNKVIQPKVVIIQKTKIRSANDSKAHMIIDTIGSGKAVILQDGQAIQATWKKQNRRTRTIYYYKDKPNEKVQFNRGQVWVVAMSDSLGSLKVQ